VRASARPHKGAVSRSGRVRMLGPPRPWPVAHSRGVGSRCLSKRHPLVQQWQQTHPFPTWTHWLRCKTKFFGNNVLKIVLAWSSILRTLFLPFSRFSTTLVVEILIQLSNIYRDFIAKLLIRLLYLPSVFIHIKINSIMTKTSY
jgi:hypothetical protein